MIMPLDQNGLIRNQPLRGRGKVKGRRFLAARGRPMTGDPNRRIRLDPGLSLPLFAFFPLAGSSSVMGSPWKRFWAAANPSRIRQSTAWAARSMNCATFSASSAGKWDSTYFSVRQLGMGPTYAQLDPEKLLGVNGGDDVRIPRWPPGPPRSTILRRHRGTSRSS